MSIPEPHGRTGFSRRFGRAALSAVLLAAALLLAPGTARAQTPSDPRNQCGALASGAAACSNQAYASGIRYDAADGWSNGVAGPVTLTVTGGSATAISAPAPPNTWTNAAIVIRTAAQGSGDSASRAVTLRVGDGSNDVTITERATQMNHGVQVHQFGKAADSTTVTLGSGVNIGTASNPMKRYGVFVLTIESDNTGDHSISSAATIHSTEFGILMDARGSGDTSVTNSGSITTAQTGGTSWHKSGIRVLDWSGGRGDDRTADTTTTVTNSGSIATSAGSARGIQVDADGLGLYRIVNSGTIRTASAADAEGIHVDARHHAGAADSRAVSVEHSGDITTSGTSSHGVEIYGGMGRGSLSVESSGDITTSGHGAHGIHVSHDSTEGGGAIRVAATEGEITTAEGGAHGIHVSVGAMNMSGAEIVNAADIDVGAANGIHVWNGGAGDFRIENAGTITASNGAGIFSEDDGAGDVTIVNRGDVTGPGGVWARKEGDDAGDVLVRQEAGEIRGSRLAAIHAEIGRWRNEDSADSPAPENEATARVEVAGGSVKAPESLGRPAVEVINNEGGSAEASVSKGATLTAMHNAGLWAYLSDRRNAKGRIRIEQGGAITAPQGVYATVPHANARTGAAADEPLIDVVWTGSFTLPEGRTGGVPANSVAHAIEFAQEFQAGEVMRSAKGLAGIDAEVLSWRILNRVAGAGDDPGEIGSAAQQTALLDVASTDAAVKARAEAIVARFRAVLTDRRLGAIPGRDDIDADGDGAYSDQEIIAYLGEFASGRLTILRDVLRRHLSEQEAAVLRALATGGDVDAALEGVTGASDAWKSEVRALRSRFNTGDIRVAVNGGSIDGGGGDGVRAFYGTQHDSNGGITVTIAEGATVKGALAGVYVAGAGMDSEGILDQHVMVRGEVTGGSDAAVHLGGGGRLTVYRTGVLVAGSSGRAILVNDPGPAVIIIHGTVRGASGADAAVRLTGGGTVTIGLAGRVEANGADAAIRGDAATTLELRGTSATQQAARAALQRVSGGIRGVSRVRVVEVDEAGRATGFFAEAPVDGDAENSSLFDVSELPVGGFDCSIAQDGRCELYEALPSFLLAMTRTPTFSERMSAPRGADGAWARVEAASGEWTADKAISTRELGYDYDVAGGRAGVDFRGAGAILGLSAHLLRGKAKMSGVGETLVTGIGAGASATWLWGGFHLDVSGQATWFDAEFESSASGALEKDASGKGLAFGVEVGRRSSLMGGRLAVTPTLGLVWSNADLNAFTDSVGSAARVSVEKARSVKARAGFTLEKGEAGRTLFFSAGLVRELSDETSVGIDDVELKTAVQPSAVRLGLGGALPLGRNGTLTLSGHYESSGSEASEYGGSASLKVSF